jgi:hypothetical protein
MAQISQALRDRIRRPSLLNKVRRAEDLIPFFKDGMYLGWSGMKREKGDVVGRGVEEGARIITPCRFYWSRIP